MHDYAFVNGRCEADCINIAWQLVDTGPNDGGFVFLPGSAKSQLELPESMQCHDVIPTSLVHPQLSARDVLIFLGYGMTHGAWTWRGTSERRGVFFQWASRHTIPGYTNTKPELAEVRNGFLAAL
jgi:ectoine hydroxylase-related dioxygenase (phytanoyl-CoA dioxygenase family)